MSTQPDFKITPDQAQLDSIPRDLRFHPAASVEPKSLTATQLESYNTNGYIKPIDVYSNEQITDLRDYFDRLLEQTIAAGGDSYSISTAHMKHGRVYDMLTNPGIVDCVADVLG
ncbi:MAG: phytanoyl-CoA dioxygenase family protein, partial [Fuerstiella sp.]